MRTGWEGRPWRAVGWCCLSVVLLSCDPTTQRTFESDKEPETAAGEPIPQPRAEARPPGEKEESKAVERAQRGEGSGLATEDYRDGTVRVVSFSRVSGKGKLKRADAEAKLLAVAENVRVCYRSLLSVASESGPAGRLTATFSVSRAGGVSDIEVTGAMSREKPGLCARLSLRTIQFDAPAELVRYRADFELTVGPVKQGFIMK